MAHEVAWQLPLQVGSPVDVGRLLRELESLDERLNQAALRKDGHDVKLPKTTHLMDRTLELNKLDLADGSQRQQLTTFLTGVKAKAPLLHMSFSADPSPKFLEQLLTWLRSELHPSLLLTVGLQPNIGAGCIVRSTNKYFDFSLRQDFAKKRDLLLEKLGPALAAPVVATAPPAVTAALREVAA